MSLRIYDLTVNYLKNPCGIDTLPRFSYKVSSDSNGDTFGDLRGVINRFDYLNDGNIHSKKLIREYKKTLFS